MEHIITTKNLNLWYGASHALKSYQHGNPGKENHCADWPSGCGKSTYLKTLNRMNDLVESCRIERRNYAFRH